MSEMIERVAEALAWDGDGYAWGRMVEEERQSYRRRAIIAIKAMREPTSEMIERIARIIMPEAWDENTAYILGGVVTRPHEADRQAMQALATTKAKAVIQAINDYGGVEIEAEY